MRGDIEGISVLDTVEGIVEAIAGFIFWVELLVRVDWVLLVGIIWMSIEVFGIAIGIDELIVGIFKLVVGIFGWEVGIFRIVVGIFESAVGIFG